MLILYICRFYAWFIAVACISRVRFTNCSCARSSRSDFCRVMEFRYIRRRVGSSIVVLSCQNNAGIRMPRKNIYTFRGIQCSAYRLGAGKDPRVCFVIFDINNIFKDHRNFSRRDLFPPRLSERLSCLNERMKKVFSFRKKGKIRSTSFCCFHFQLLDWLWDRSSPFRNIAAPPHDSPRVTWRSSELRHYRSKDLCESSRKDDRPEKYISERNLRPTRRRRDMQTFDYTGDASSLNWIMSVPPNEPPSSDNAAAMIIYNSINVPYGVSPTEYAHSNLLLSTRMMVLPFFFNYFFSRLASWSR